MTRDELVIAGEASPRQAVWPVSCATRPCAGNARCWQPIAAKYLWLELLGMKGSGYAGLRAYPLLAWETARPGAVWDVSARLHKTATQINEGFNKKKCWLQSKKVMNLHANLHIL